MLAIRQSNPVDSFKKGFGNVQYLFREGSFFYMVVVKDIETLFYR